MLLAVASSTIVRLWDHSTNETTTLDNNAPVNDLAWGHDGSIFATCTTATATPNIAIRSVHNQATTESFSSSCIKFSESTLPNNQHATSVAFGGKSRYLCVASTNKNTATSNVSVFDLKKKGRVRLYDVSTTLTEACIDPTDTFVVAASSSNIDGSIYLYQLAESGRHTPIQLRFKKSVCSGCNALAFSLHNTRNVVVGKTDGSIQIWDVQCGVFDTPLCFINTSTPSPITDICFSPCHPRLLASCSTNGLYFHDATSGKSISTIKCPASCCTSLSLNTDGVSCAVGTVEGTVLLYDLRKTADGQVNELPLQSNGVVSPVISVRFQPQKMSSRKSSHKQKDARLSDIFIKRKDDARGSQIPQLVSFDDTDAGIANNATNDNDRTSQTVYELPPPNDELVTKDLGCQYSPKLRHEDSLLASDFVNGRLLSMANSEHSHWNVDKDERERNDETDHRKRDESAGQEENHSDNDKATLQLYNDFITRNAVVTLTPTQPKLSARLATMQREIRDMRSDYNASIRELHSEIMHQFQNLSVDMMGVFKQQADIIVRLMEENVGLKKENEGLRRF
eukprot:scaffold1540_cov194-Alexandrium_tamarense.AAC.39